MYFCKAHCSNAGLFRNGPCGLACIILLQILTIYVEYAQYTPPIFPIIGIGSEGLRLVFELDSTLELSDLDREPYCDPDLPLPLSSLEDCSPLSDWGK